MQFSIIKILLKKGRGRKCKVCETGFPFYKTTLCDNKKLFKFYKTINKMLSKDKNISIKKYGKRKKKQKKKKIDRWFQKFQMNCFQMSYH